MKIYSVIVCYYPNIENLQSLCNVLSINTSVILLDNTDAIGSIEQNELFNDYKVVSFCENKGIAYAQNKGIQIAISDEADVIVFFDQDSMIDTYFLDKLLQTIQLGTPNIVVPIQVDSRTGQHSPIYKFNSWGILNKYSSTDLKEPCDVDLIIASGCAATVETFIVAGGMDEDYFIDYVDTEWGIRCKKIGIPIKAIPSVKMEHTIGERTINMGLIQLYIHSPTRTYYKIRNCFIFFRKSNAPIIYKLKDVISTLVHSIIILTFVKDKTNYLNHYYFALVDGLRGKVGKRILP